MARRHHPDSAPATDKKTSGTDTDDVSAPGEPATWRPKQKTYLGWIDLLAIVGVFLGANLIGVVFDFVCEYKFGTSAEFGTFIGNSIGFLLTIAFALYQKRLRTDDRPLIRFAPGKTTPWIVLWGTILILSLSMVIEPVVGMFPESHFELIKNAIGTGGWAMMTTIVMAPLLEEILFRGVIQDGAMRKYGNAWGILIGAFVFGVMHFIPAQMFNAFFMGLVLGFIYYLSRSLIPVILIHAINNAIAYFGMILYDGKFVTTREMLGDDALYYMVYASAGIFVLIGCVHAFAVLRKKRRKTDTSDV